MGEEKTYSIRSKDREQAVYFDPGNGNYYIQDVGKQKDGLILFITVQKYLAVSIWQTTGGEYGEFEVVEE